MGKKPFFILFLAFLLFFPFFEQIKAEEGDHFIDKQESKIRLSQRDVNGIVSTLNQKVVDEWISVFGLSSSYKEEAILMILRDGIKRTLLNYALIQAPKEIIGDFVGMGTRILPVVVDFGFSSLLDFGIDEAKRRTVEWLLENELRTGGGNLLFSYKSYTGERQNIELPFILLYNPRNNKVEINIYSSEKIETSAQVLGATGLKELPPFKVNIKGEIKEGRYGGYTWTEEPVFEFDFSSSVPDFQFKKLNFVEKRISSLKEKLLALEIAREKIENLFARITEMGKSAAESTKGFGRRIWDGVKGFFTSFSLFQAKVAPLPENNRDFAMEEKVKEILDLIKSADPSIDEEMYEEHLLEEEEADLDALWEKLREIEGIVDELEEEMHHKDEEENDGSEEDKDEEENDEEESVIIEEVCNVDVNTASKEELQEIKGIGPTFARRIIELRPFSSLNDLIEVSGIGEITLEGIIDQGCAYVDPSYYTQNSSGSGSSSNFDFDPDPDPDSDNTVSPSITLNYPEENPLDEEIIVEISVSDLPDGDYDVKISIEKEDKILSEIKDDKEEWNSSHYYLNSALSGAETKEFSLIIWEDESDFTGEAALIVKARDNVEGKIVITEEEKINIVSSRENKDETEEKEENGKKEDDPEPKEYSKVLISEIQIEPIGERFLELYNPNSNEVDLTGWYIQRKTENGSSWGSLVASTYLEGMVIQPESYLLITRLSEEKSNVVVENLTLTESNSVVLKNPDREIVDLLGWDKAQEFEEAPFPQNPETKDPVGDWLLEIGFEGERESSPVFYQSLGRKKGYQDTDNNAEDFEIQKPTPGTGNMAFEEEELEDVLKDITEYYNTPVETEIISGPSTSTVLTEAVFTFQSTKEDSRFECRLNGQEWEDCQSPQSYNDLEYGQHVFSVRAIDLFSNVESNPPEYVWTVHEESFWPTFQQNSQRKGQSSVLGPAVFDEPVVDVFIQGSGSNDYFSSPVIDSKNNLYFKARINDKEGVYAFSEDGIQKWHYEESLSKISSPVITSTGNIFFFVHTKKYEEATLVLLDKEGNVLWQKPIDSYPVGHPAVYNNAIYFFASGKAVSIDVLTGEENWRYEIGEDSAVSSFAVSKTGFIYFGAENMLYALNPDGTERWSKTFEGKYDYYPWKSPVVKTPVIGEDGIIYLIVRELGDWSNLQRRGLKSCLFALSDTGDSGEKEWSKCGSTFNNTDYLTLSGEKNIYFPGGFSDNMGSWFAVIYGFDVSGGEIEGWPVRKFRGKGKLFVTDKEDNVYGIFDKKSLRAYSKNGELQWFFDISPSYREKALSFDIKGNLYVAGPKKLYVVRNEEAEKEDTVSPEVSVELESAKDVLTISWSGEDRAPEGVEPSGIAGFQLKYSENEEDWSYYPSEEEYTEENEYELAGEEGEIYYFKVRAKDNNENISKWATASTTIPESGIDINTAPLEKLVRIYGIGDTIAQRIIDYRDEELFSSLDDLENVKGIGPKTLEKIKEEGLVQVIKKNDDETE